MPQKIDPTRKFRYRVINGKRMYFTPKSIQEWDAAHEGKEMIDESYEAIPETTSDQHAYMRGGIIKHTCMNSDRFAGWEEEDIYSYFAKKYLSIVTTKDMMGTQVEVYRQLSMATCGIQRSSEFIRRVLQDLAEFKDCPLYPPEPADIANNKYSKVNRGKIKS